MNRTDARPRAADQVRSTANLNLGQWLEYQQHLNPMPIDLGLERLRPVARRLGLESVDCPLISVAGTNGKGSAVAFLEAIAIEHGLRVGAYGSPHLEHYAECVRVDGEPRPDAEIVDAFRAVEAQRGAVPLTAFEFRTLAAMHQLRDQRPDLMVLEVGLGGRLDAVNVLDADVALIGAIGLDHGQWLGNTLEQVAAEKCGIARADRPVVCADPHSVELIRGNARRIGARLCAAGEGLRVDVRRDGWCVTLHERRIGPLPAPCLQGEHQITNAAGAIAAFTLALGGATLDPACVARAMLRARLKGRLQRVGRAPLRVVDVAHNPHACAALRRWIRGGSRVRDWRAVCAMYQDKDIEGCLAELAPCINRWYVASLPPPRGASEQRTGEALRRVAPGATVSCFEDVERAWSAAAAGASPECGLLGFGSFETVRRILALESPRC